MRTYRTASHAVNGMTFEFSVTASTSSAKDKNDSSKQMGFGHRVYKNFDPRAKLMGKICADVLGELGLENDRLFKLAKELGISASMFTCIFALARTVGRMTQWEEMITDPEYKIGRPRQLYIGAVCRDVTPRTQH